MAQEVAPTPYPADFVQLLFDSLGAERGSELIKHLSDEVPVSVRCNPQKISLEGLRAHFGDSAGEAVEWCPEAFYLKERPSFTLDPLFHAGAYYVQEASSMYVGKLLERSMAGGLGGYDASGGAGFSLRVLDLCAAPGGKTTHILSKLPSGSILVTNEVIRSRATVLAENVAKWGSAAVVVSNNDPADFGSFEDYFDLVVVDAPCSGEGMFRKDEKAREEWSLKNVSLCVARQKRIVSDIWPTLKPRGYMIYSTCTFNKHENSENVEWICSELGGEVVEQRQFLPGEVVGEGFFCALIRKTAEAPSERGGAKGLLNATAVGIATTSGKVRRTAGAAKSSFDERGSGNISKQTLQECSNIVSTGYLLQAKGDLVKAYPQALYKEMMFAGSVLRVIHSGVAVAVAKGRDLIPEADLALSTIIAPDAFASVELSREDALKFLAKEPLILADAPRGYILVKYRGFSLGFVKNLGNRTNNLHPMARRIRQAVL